LQVAKEYLKKNYMEFAFAKKRYTQFSVANWAKYAKPCFLGRVGTKRDLQQLAKRRRESGMFTAEAEVKITDALAKGVPLSKRKKTKVG